MEPASPVPEEALKGHAFHTYSLVSPDGGVEYLPEGSRWRVENLAAATNEAMGLMHLQTTPATRCLSGARARRPDKRTAARRAGEAATGRERKEKDGKRSYFITGPFLQGDRKNRNGRIYESRILAKEVARYNENFIQRLRSLRSPYFDVVQLILKTIDAFIGVNW